MAGKLIAVNTAVFLILIVVQIITTLYLDTETLRTIGEYIAGPPATHLEWILFRPWTLFTQMFTHIDPLHFIFNMLSLYFVSRIFTHFLGEQRLLLTYLMGGIFGYLFHVFCYSVFPLFQELPQQGVIGASGAIVAIFTAVAIHQPKYRVKFFGIIPVSLIVLAILYIFIDLSRAGSADGVAHMAHLGGGIFGALSVIKVNSPNNFMNRFQRWLSKFKLPKLSLKRKPKMKVYKGEAKNMSDEEYNVSKKAHQDRIDAILDKISKKGYEGLTKEEKQILFDESKRKES